jgi:hypothetical protein
MTRLSWGDIATRHYETGVDRGVLYPEIGAGVAWNGLVSVQDNPSDSDSSSYYIDGIKYYNRQGPGSFAATLEAYTYPDEFMPYDGILNSLITQQPRRSFGLSYRTKLGNDVDGSDHGYKIHLVYNALASPSKRTNSTLGKSIEALLFSWSITTVPISIPGHRPSAHLVIDTTVAPSQTIAAVEDVLYGSDILTPSLPWLGPLLTLFEGNE